MKIVFIYIGIVDVDIAIASIHAGYAIPVRVSTRVKWWVWAKKQHFYLTSPQRVVERYSRTLCPSVRGGGVAWTHA